MRPDDHDAVDEVRLELGALGHGPRHDGGGRGGEGHLEQEERGHGQVAVARRPVTEEPALGAEEVVALAVGQGVAHGEERHGAGAEVHQVLHHDVADALGPGEAGLDEGEAGLHEDHQRGAHDDEDVVQVGLDICGRQILSARRRRHREGGGTGDRSDHDLGFQWGSHGSPPRGWPRTTGCRGDHTDGDFPPHCTNVTPLAHSPVGYVTHPAAGRTDGSERADRTHHRTPGRARTPPGGGVLATLQLVRVDAGPRAGPVRRRRRPSRPCGCG
jgi:hypothetical protein